MGRWQTERADWAQRQAGLELRIVQLQEQLLATLTQQMQQPAPQPALPHAPATPSSTAQSAVMSSSTAQRAAMPPASAANAEASAAMSAAPVSLEAAIAAEAGPGAASLLSAGKPQTQRLQRYRHCYRAEVMWYYESAGHYLWDYGCRVTLSNSILVRDKYTWFDRHSRHLQCNFPTQQLLTTVYICNGRPVMLD